MYDFRAIIAELLVERKKLTDASALQDAENSLKNMLDAFIQDTQPSMPAEKRLDIVERMDMSVISSQVSLALLFLGFVHVVLRLEGT